MATAIIHLRWRPPDFWDATPHEFWAAIEELERVAKARRTS
jgi:hypothetical protein